MSVTIKEIARFTGLSIPTVGNVMGKAAGRYSEETRRRVAAAARELGYKPNASARAVREGRTECAALVLSRSRLLTHSHIPLGLIDGIDDELSRHNMHLAVSRLTDEQLSQPGGPPKVLREYMADGMIVNYTHEIPPSMLELIEDHHTPAVWLNAQLKQDCVYPDDFGAAEIATRKLIALGHRRIDFVHFMSPESFPGLTFNKAKDVWHYSAMDRADGYSKAMNQSGLSPRIHGHDRFVLEVEQLKICRWLLRGKNRPTAVIVYSDHDVSAVMTAAAIEGLSVPCDLSVLAFYPSDLWVAGQHVSAMAVPTAEMGRRAVVMLRKRIADPNTRCVPEAIPYDIATGASVAVAPCIV